MNAEEKLLKAIRSCERALENLHKGNKRITVGDLDFAQDFIIAAKMLLISQIKEEEGEF